MPRAAAKYQDSGLAASAAAELVRAAERFLEHGADAFIGRHGLGLVEAAKAKGCKFALRIMLPDGRARVDVVTAEGESVRLFEVAVGEAARP